MERASDTQISPLYLINRVKSSIIHNANRKTAIVYIEFLMG